MRVCAGHVRWLQARVRPEHAMPCGMASMSACTVYMASMSAVNARGACGAASRNWRALVIGCMARACMRPCSHLAHGEALQPSERRCGQRRKVVNDAYVEQRQVDDGRPSQESGTDLGVATTRTAPSTRLRMHMLTPLSADLESWSSQRHSCWLSRSSEKRTP
jgi:hypothetical protein